MRKSCPFVFACIFLLSGDLFSQEKKFALTVSPAVLSFISLTPQVGAEYYFTDRWSLGTEFCYAAPRELKTNFDRTRLFRTGVELKRFLATRRNRAYLSFQSAYTIRNMTDTDSGFFHMKTDGAKYRSADIHSPILSFAVKLGLQKSLGESFFLDIFFGMGSRTIFTRYDAENIIPAVIPERRGWYTIIPSYQRNYTITTFHMPVGLKFGFRL